MFRVSRSMHESPRREPNMLKSTKRFLHVTSMCRKLLAATVLLAAVPSLATAEIIGSLSAERPDGRDDADTALRRLLLGSFRDVPRELRLSGDPAIVVVVGVMVVVVVAEVMRMLGVTVVT